MTEFFTDMAALKYVTQSVELSQHEDSKLFFLQTIFMINPQLINANCKPTLNPF